MDKIPTPLMLLSATVMGSVSAYLAHKRGKNPYLWFGIGFLFGIFGIFAIFLLPRFSGKKRAKPTPPSWSLKGPSDKFWYYLAPGGEQKGPLSRDAIKKALDEGMIDHSTYIWHEELSDWIPLKETLSIQKF